MDTDARIIAENADVIQHPASSIEDNICLIEPGEYELQFDTCRTYWIFKRPKMAIWFRIVSPGPAFGLMIPRHYNLKYANRRGGFKVGPHSDLLREYALVTGERPPRLDRIPIESRYKPRILLGEAKTVSHDHEQKKLATALHYSVLKCLLGKVTG